MQKKCYHSQPYHDHTYRLKH